MICFQVAQPAKEDRFYSFQIDENVVHLLIPPQILKGEKIGYLRVQPLVEGKTQIGIGNGKAKLEIEVGQDDMPSHMDELHPQIVTPPTGATVWGAFAVGVEQLTMDDPTLLPIPTLRLPNGQEVTGKVVPDQKAGPHARWVFTVNAGDLTPGANKLVVVSTDEKGGELESAPIYVDAIRPAPVALSSGTCTSDATEDRPAKDGGAPPMINDEKYGQGMVLNVSNEGTPWCLPLWIAEPGVYQLMVTTRGEFGGDALPSLGLSIDERPQVETISRLATTEWQRIPVGHPIALDEGGHFINVGLRNSFSQGPADSRTVFLQKYELLRITPATNQVASSGDGAAAAGGSAMASMTSMTSAGTTMAMAGAASSPMSMQAGGSMMAMAGATTGGPASAENVHLTFADNIDGEMVTGQVEVRARCWWPDQAHTPPPRVELFVNKRLVETQTSRYPQFYVDPAAFTVGSNTVEMRALFPSGVAANSVPFTLQVPRDFPLPSRPFRRPLDFTTYDSGLSCTITPAQKQNDPETATFYSNGQSIIKLPDELTGKYRVMVTARGDQFQGAPNLSVGLNAEGNETKLADVPVTAKMGSFPAGQIDLPPGPKALTIAFTNDLSVPGQGDRNLYVRSVRLIPSDDQPDTTPPVVAVAVAPRIIGLGATDAVVARVMDDHRVAAADLLIDDQPQHLDQTPLHGLGPMVFPLLTRDLKPGEHHLQVVARDGAKNVGSSPEIEFTVLAQAETAPSKYERALFLLNRFGYGPEPLEIAAILTQGETNWLQSRLAEDATAPAEMNEQESLRAQFPERHDAHGVAVGAVDYLLTEPNPVRARFVMWAENHFSTWLTKDGPAAKSAEHQSFMELGPAPFFDLLFTSATSPAMLFYLDQFHSYSHALNENYAREIMELHTLGAKGGYTQKDVTTLADLLTGWTLASEGACDGSGGYELDRFFGYDPQLNTGSACRVFGVEFPGVEPEKRFDRVLMALEYLSSHPSCAQFISRKLCEHYAADPAPPKLVDDLAQVYLETGGDLRAMLLAMSQHPDFWSSSGQVADPIDFGVRTARMARSANPTPVNDLISASGMGMFDRATPDGYPDDNGYSANSNALLQRWRFAKNIENDFVASGLIPNSWRPADEGWDPETTQRIVDLAAVRMTGNVLSEASNDAAQKLLASAPPNTDARIHALATFICQLPENSLK